MASKKDPSEFERKRQAINAEAARRRKDRKNTAPAKKSTSRKASAKSKGVPEDELPEVVDYGVDTEGNRAAYSIAEEEQASEEKSSERTAAEAQKDVIDYDTGDEAADVDTAGSLVRGMRGAGRATVSEVPLPADDTFIFNDRGAKPRTESDQSRRVARDEHLRRRGERIAGIRAGASTEPVTSVPGAGVNFVPANVLETRRFSDFPVTPAESARRADYFGFNDTPDDTRPVSGVKLNEETGGISTPKMLPGTDVQLQRLSNLDTQVQKERNEVLGYAGAAESLAKAAEMIPVAVPEEAPEEKPILTGGTRTSADVEVTPGDQKVRGGKVSDIDPGTKTDTGESVIDLVRSAAEVMGRSVSGTGSDRAATLGALLGNQFQPKAVVQQGRQVSPEKGTLPAGPNLTARDAPELREWAEKASSIGEAMPTEWDVAEKGLVDVQGVPFRSIDPEREVSAEGTVVNPGKSGDLETQALSNKRTSAPPGASPLPERPAFEGDVDYQEALQIQNEELAANPDVREAALPNLRKLVAGAMGAAPGKVQVTPPRPYSRDIPVPPESAGRSSALSPYQMHNVMKGARQAANVGGPMTSDEDIGQVLTNEAATQRIAREYMETIPGVGEGSDVTGGVAGGRKSQEIAETGRATPGGSPLTGASSVAGGPKTRQIKVRMRNGEEKGVSGQPVIPESAPSTKRNKNRAPEMTLPELKVVHPLLGSLYDRTAEGAGRAVSIKQSSFPRRLGENRPTTPGTVRFIRQIGGRDKEFSTNLSVVKPSGTRNVMRASGSTPNPNFVDPSREGLGAAKVYEYGPESELTAPETGPETTTGTIVAGAGSIFRPNAPTASVVGRVNRGRTGGVNKKKPVVGGDNKPITGVTIDAGGNPIVTDQSAAAKNPAIIRAAMRGYRQQGIRAAKAESRMIDFHMRGLGTGVTTDDEGNPTIPESSELFNQSEAVKNAAIRGFVQRREGDQRRVDAERSMAAVRQTTGASSGRGVLTDYDGRGRPAPAVALTPTQIDLRKREGLPANPVDTSTGRWVGSAPAMGRSIQRAEAYEKATDEAAKAGTPFPSLSDFDNLDTTTSAPPTKIDTGGRSVMEGDQWGMMKGAPTRQPGDRRTRAKPKP